MAFRVRIAGDKKAPCKPCVPAGSGESFNMPIASAGVPVAEDRPDDALVVFNIEDEPARFSRTTLVHKREQLSELNGRALPATKSDYDRLIERILSEILDYQGLGGDVSFNSSAKNLRKVVSENNPNLPDLPTPDIIIKVE